MTKEAGMEEKFVTTGEFAKHLGISRSYCSNLCQHRIFPCWQSPRGDYLINLAQVEVCKATLKKRKEEKKKTKQEEKKKTKQEQGDK